MVLKLDRISNIKNSLNHLSGTTWQRIFAAVVYFLLFTILISSSLFVSKLHLTVGEPSPQLITAPWSKEIDDVQKYQEDLAAYKSTHPIYKADEDYIASLTKDLGQSFTALTDAINSKDAEKTKIDKLRQTTPFTALPDGVLSTLIKRTPDDLSAAEQAANQFIISRAQNVDSGARTYADVAPLIDKMKQDISQTSLPDDMKVFLDAFVDTKINHPTLVLDEQATDNAAHSSVKMEKQNYKANQKIVGLGEIVDQETMSVLQAYGLVDSTTPWRTTGGIALLVLVGMASIIVYVRHYKPDVYHSTAKMVLLGLTPTLVLAIGKGVIALNLGGTELDSLTGILIPVAWATTTVAILVDEEIALLVAVILSVFVSTLADPMLSTSYGIQVGIVALFGGLVGVHSVSHLSQRSELARAGLFIAGVNALTVSAIALMTGMHLTAWAVALLLAIVNGLVSSVFTVGTLHWFESGFHITSAVRLLELSNPNRPLLKRLLMEAPGTYHHSILVGNLAEAAAEAVDADATLVRVGSLYHDIGKLKRPYFFIENQFAHDNPHDKLAPTLSCLIITSHVKDGLELGKENKLPQPILDIIAQHHGDSLVGFFYHKALEENEEVPEDAFHYDGPRPQSKEVALVCLADSVEAAVRSMKQPTPGRIEGLVRKIIKDKLNDGQLDQCDLTFQDLDRIAMAFVRVLSGIFHSRVEYPELPNTKSSAQSQNAQSQVNSSPAPDNKGEAQVEENNK